MHKQKLALWALLAALASSAVAAEMGTAFTYQGRLCDGGVPASGLYDLQFALYDAGSGGSQQGATFTTNAVAVSNGLFPVSIDFGATVFAGDARWLEISACTNGAGTPAPLLPRQELKPTPYALYAKNAAAAATATTASGTPWAGLPGLPAGFADGVDNDTTYSEGEGLSLFGTMFSVSTNFLNGRYWALGGNAGTTAGTHFVGTTDDQALELKVNRDRALRLEPTATGGTVNVIGGSRFNVVSGSGATIAGGGTSNSPNKVLNSYGTIAGGIAQTVDSAYGMIGGGFGNEISMNSGYGTVGGGSQNRIASYATASTISAGYDNMVDGSFTSPSYQSTISGGRSNFISMGAMHASIGGGATNVVGTDSPFSTIAGGRLNRIGDDSDASAIGGGRGNVVGADALEVTISGGGANTVGDNSDYSFIGGGLHNGVSNESPYSVIAGGSANKIWISAPDAFIGGGEDNAIRANASHGAVVGGEANVIGTDSDYSFIGGGFENNIAPNAWHATIAGGNVNTIGTNADYSFGGGGQENKIGADASRAVISGGYQNTVQTNADYATIAGGKQAKAADYGQFAYAGGNFADRGDAQASMFVLRRKTTTSNLTELFLDGEIGNQRRITLPKRSTWAFDILVVGRNEMAGDPPPTTAITAAFHIRGTAITDDILTNIDIYENTPLHRVIGTWEARVETDANNRLLIKARGSSGLNVRWVANVRTVEVTYP